MKKIILSLIILTVITVAYGMKSYTLDLKSCSTYHFNRLCEITDFIFNNQSFRIYEYDNLQEFSHESGGRFFIKGFTNSSGTFIQSRNLLRGDFNGTLIHELLHALIKSQYPVPPWFEEGLVCIVTDEFADTTDIPVMKDVKSFETNQAASNWEITSYCLGCIREVKEILCIE